MRPILAFLLLITACHESDKQGPSPVSSTVSTAAPVSSAPITGLADGGRLEILEPRWAFAVADANGDGTDDIVALTKVASSDGVERRLVAFDGKTRGVLWRSDLVRPWETGVTRARAMVLVGGANVAVMRRWSTVEFYDLKSGSKKDTLTLDAAPGEHSCPDPDAPGRWFLELTEGDGLGSHPLPVNTILDVGAMKATPARERPAFCPTHWVDKKNPLSDCYFTHYNERARAECAPLGFAPQTPFKTVFVVTTPEAALAVGEDTALRFDPKTKNILWTRQIPGARELRSVDVTSAGVLFAIEEPKGTRIVMLDTNTGFFRFERAIDGVVEDPRVVGARLYVPRHAHYESSGYDPAGAVEVFDSYTGKPLFSLGGNEVLP